jgi:hypothetical protein
MAFQEYTAQLPVGRGSRRELLEFSVDLDVETLEAIDIYTDRNNYEMLPSKLKKYLWATDKNPLFVHVDPKDRLEAWRYLRANAFLDEEAEELLGR